MTVEETLPLGWAQTTIGELCELSNGKAFKPSEWSSRGLPIIRIQNLNDPEAPFNYYEGDIDDRFRVAAGDLLFAWSGTPGTSFGAHTWRGGNAVLNQHIFRVDFDEHAVDKSYFMHAINSRLRELIGKAHGGAGLAHVTKGRLEETKIPLPPMREQRRIVAKIEQLFSELDKGVEALEVTQKQIAVCRMALLKKAFAGQFTHAWRVRHPDKVRKYPDVIAEIPPDLRRHCTQDWAWRRLGDISQVTGGLTKNSKRSALPVTMKYLRVANVYADRLELDDVSDIGVTESEFESVKLQPGDMLVVEGNGSIEQIGRVAVWNGELSEVGHQNHLIRVRLEHGMLPRFYLAFLMSPLGRDLITRQANSTSGLHTLSISKVSGLPVPVPSSAEQEEVLRSLAAPMSEMDRLAEEIEVSLAKTSGLRNAILKRAFSGELASQDPRDEPASVLLERIKAEQEQSVSKRKSCRRKEEMETA